MMPAVYVTSLPLPVAEDMARYLQAHAMAASLMRPDTRAIWVVGAQTALPVDMRDALAVLVLGDGDLPPELPVRRLPLPVRLPDCLHAVRELALAQGDGQLLVREGWVLLMSSRQMVCDGKAPISLTDKEAALLRLLIEADGEMVSKQALLREVWHYDRDMDTHTLETHIYRLRGKLAPIFGDLAAQTSAGILTLADGYSFLR
jgi:hypothetical protein